LDPETKHWLYVNIIEVNVDSYRVSWKGYPKSDDCWLKKQYVREPVLTRPFSSRNAIKKENFPVRKEPKYLQRGDQIHDIQRKITDRVATNDPFQRQVLILFHTPFYITIIVGKIYQPQ
jgi:hypothetical protein